MADKIQLVIDVDSSAAVKGLRDTESELKRLESSAQSAARGFSPLAARMEALSAAQGRAASSAQELAVSHHKLTAAAGAAAGRIGELNQKLANLRMAREHVAGLTSEVDRLGTSFGKVGLVGGAAMVGSLGQYAGFDKSMAFLKARVTATAAERAALERQAIQLGNDERFAQYSAADAARGMGVLAQGGMSPRDILGGGAEATMMGSAAGGMDVGPAAQLGLDAMTAFKAEARELPRIMDEIAAGSLKGGMSMSQLAEALTMGGAAASAMDRSSKETIATLALLSRHMLRGSDAGTAYKTFMLSLNGISDDAVGLMKKYGVELADQHGRFKSTAEIAGILKDRLGSLSQAEQTAALKTMFGADAYRVAVALMQEGADGVRQFEQAVARQSAASQIAKAQNDSLAGSWEALKSTVETAATSYGSSYAPAARMAIDLTTGFAGALGNTDNWLGKAAQATIQLTALVGLGGAAYLKATAAITQYRLAKALLVQTTQQATTAITAETAATRGAAGALASLGKATPYLLAVAAAWGPVKLMAEAANGAFQDVLKTLRSFGGIGRFVAAELQIALSLMKRHPMFAAPLALLDMFDGSPVGDLWDAGKGAAAAGAAGTGAASGIFKMFDGVPEAFSAAAAAGMAGLSGGGGVGFPAPSTGGGGGGGRKPRKFSLAPADMGGLKPRAGTSVTRSSSAGAAQIEASKANGEVSIGEVALEGTRNEYSAAVETGQMLVAQARARLDLAEAMGYSEQQLEAFRARVRAAQEAEWLKRLSFSKELSLLESDALIHERERYGVERERLELQAEEVRRLRQVADEKQRAAEQAAEEARQKRLTTASERTGLAELMLERGKLVGLGRAELEQRQQAVSAAKLAEAAELARQGRRLDAMRAQNEALGLRGRHGGPTLMQAIVGGDAGQVADLLQVGRQAGGLNLEAVRRPELGQAGRQIGEAIRERDVELIRTVAELIRSAGRQRL